MKDKRSVFRLEAIAEVACALVRPKDPNLDWPAPGFLHPCHGFSRTETNCANSDGKMVFPFTFMSTSRNDGGMPWPN